MLVGIVNSCFSQICNRVTTLDSCQNLVQGQLLEGVDCHIYLYCFTFDDINLNRAFVIIVLFPKKYSNKKVCANDMRKKNALGIY